MIQVHGHRWQTVFFGFGRTLRQRIFLAMSNAMKVAIVPIDAIGHLTPMLAVCHALANHPEVSVVRGFGSSRVAKLFLQQSAEFEITLRDHGEGKNDLAWKSFVNPLSDAELTMQRLTQFAPDIVLYDPFAVLGALGAHMCGVPSAALVTMAGYGTLGDDFVRKYSWERHDLLAANADYFERFRFNFRERGFLPVLFPSPDLSMIAAIERMSVPIDPSSQPMLHQLFRSVKGREACIGPCLGQEHLAHEVIKTLCRDDEEARNDPFPFTKLEQARAAGKKIIVFSLGTVITDFRYDTPVGGQPTGEAFLRKSLDVVAEAVQKEQGLLVAAVGPKFPLSGLALSSNAIIKRVLPLRRLLQGNADAFITHHGASSQAESILAGVPMISLPGVGDQIFNAKVAARHGAAVVFWDVENPLQQCDVATMRCALRAVLDSDGPKMACLKLADEMRMIDGPRAAAGLVTALAQSHRSQG
ncbi:glycosyltransferase [Neorhizobium sp. BETTINA12A]|uniref:glycosyltransferase n=1 Tax=Neorhizobium sp. BETTINA12A TaxID=2908924 RepID=UPI001FF55A0D|nr:glycosyltransferase [Neorhizobium sp. BETTINA12A]MCJ9750396.1 glycosyltransferase [Neorhizobium sp. BETTINA12A]